MRVESFGCYLLLVTCYLVTVQLVSQILQFRRCEERSDAAIQKKNLTIDAKGLDCFAAARKDGGTIVTLPVTCSQQPI